MNTMDQIAEDIVKRDWPEVYLVSPSVFHRFAMDSNGKIEKDNAGRYTILVTENAGKPGNRRSCRVTSDDRAKETA